MTKYIFRLVVCPLRGHRWSGYLHGGPGESIPYHVGCYCCQQWFPLEQVLDD